MGFYFAIDSEVSTVLEGIGILNVDFLYLPQNLTSSKPIGSNDGEGGMTNP